jgi:hypothetical protein
MDPLTLLAGLGPLVVDLGKSLIGRFITKGDYKPVNITEFLQVKASELDMFKALNEAGGGHASYPWVEAITRLQRPVVAGVTMLVWTYSHTAGTPSDEINNFAACIGFYLFADRTLFKVGAKK